MKTYFKIILFVIIISLLQPLVINAQNKANPLKTDVDTLAWLVDFSNAIAAENHMVAPWALKHSLDLQEKLSSNKDSLYFNTYLNNILLYKFSGQFQDALEFTKNFIHEAKGTEYEIDGYWNLFHLYIEIGQFNHAATTLQNYLSLVKEPKDYFIYLLCKENLLYYDASSDLGIDYINLIKEIICHPEHSYKSILIPLRHWASICDNKDYPFINSKLEEIILNEQAPEIIMEASMQRYYNSLQIDDNKGEMYLHKIVSVFNSYLESQKLNKTNTIGAINRDLFGKYVEALEELAAIHFDKDLQTSYSYFKKIGELFEEDNHDSRARLNGDIKLDYLSRYYSAHLIFYLEDASRNATPTLDYMYSLDEFVNKYRSFYAEYIDHVASRIGHLSKEEKYIYLSNFYDHIDDIIFLENVFDNTVSEKHTNLYLGNRIPSFNLCACYRGLVMDSDLQLNHRRLEDKDTSTIIIPKYDDYIKAIKNKQSNSTCLFYVKHHDGVDDHYGVFVLNKDTTYPKYYGLGSENDIFGTIKDKLDIYTSDILYKKILQPISHLIDNTEDLYIIPDGILYSVNFAALQDSSKNPLYKQYNIKQLSDIRQLLKERTSFKIKDAVLYGGLKYHMKDRELKQLESCDNTDYYRQIYIPDSLFTRGSISYLPQSKIEVNKIKDILKRKDINVSIRSGKKGTEESFKYLSNQSPSIIHIATHGFYYKTKSAEESEGNMYESGMLRSGLLMSGGADALCGVPSERFDDGILLADEVAQLDLRGTELIVLSACETGLGDTTTEGLIGLVRGFKLAGAQTLILSLWPVNDFVTNELMTTFYSYLCDGKTKRDAFYKAIDDCRAKYQHPRLWAPFVMID